MRILILALIFTCSLASYADPGKNLTDEKLRGLIKNIQSESETMVHDKGTYLLLVVPKRQKYYVVTKPNNAAHPGYIEWSVRVKGGEAFLDAKGVHGANGDEFHKFESVMNEVMVNYLKSQLNNSGK